MDADIVVGVVIAAVAAGAIVTLMFPKWRPAFWQMIADKTGLTYYPEWWLMNPHLKGVYRRYSTLIDNHTPATRRPETYTRLIIKLQHTPKVTLHIVDKELETYGIWLPPADFITEDDAVDQKFTIACEPPNFILKLLQTPNVRQRLLKSYLLRLWIRNTELHVEQLGLERDPERVCAALDLAIGIACIVDAEA